ncbi:MAG: Lon protease family protein [Anaerolineae bacterium]
MTQASNNGNRALTVDQLRRRCDPSVFHFASTAELPPLLEVIGQERAVGAIAFGIDIESQGYHMYALGPAGTGKTTTIRKFLDQRAAERQVPDDWCYVNNFEDADRPRALHLPAGMGARFKADMDRFSDELKAEVPRALESEQYQQAAQQIATQFERQRQELMEELAKRARQQSFALMQTPQGIGLAPLVEGEVITPEQFQKLPDDRRREIERAESNLQNELHEAMRRLPQLQREARDKLQTLDREAAGYAVGHLIDDLKQQYAQFEQVTIHLEQVRADVLNNIAMFRELEQLEQVQQQNPLAALMGARPVTLDQYRVNLIVDNSYLKGAPVVLETNPTFYNLIGRVEQQAQFGALVTNFTMIKAGALQRANGGYLMLSARDVLTKPFSWDALKRALHDRVATIETMGEELRVITTRSIEPEPIPLDIKVVLLGDPSIYYLLYTMDEEFQELFKVKADFATFTEWNDESVERYAQFIGTVCREESLRHFDPSGVALVVEQGAREIENQEKVSTRFGDVVDLVRQSSHWAGVKGHDLVTAEDVQKAVDERIHRADRLEKLLEEAIEKNIIMIDTQGQVTGQVNGLSVLPQGDYAFGRPTRITARSGIGRGGVVHIDREAGLGGPIHNKGVLILAGYLTGTYAHDMPLALSATLTFEQTYEGVEGDSASSAELYALLSSLSGIPLKQQFAVTGSVNQLGQVQPIGGANEKIEGFYDTCVGRGLTGDQGVIIPESNVRNLMLRQDVLDAVRDGRFHIYSVASIDQGIELLTGVPAGERGPDGTYPGGTVNRAVHQRLTTLAEIAKEYSTQAVEPGKAGQSSTPAGTAG